MGPVLAWVMPFTPYPYRGEEGTCDLCGAGETELICEYDRRFKRLRTVACVRCGLIRTDPMPTAAEVADYYRLTYRRDYQMGATRPSRRHRHRTEREAAGRLALLAPALRPGARLLDFGSGAGVFLGAAAAAGYAVTGIEPGADFASHARATYGVEVINEMWENIRQPLAPFDVITAVEVLEHLRQPVAALRWLASLVADGGVIYVTVPDALPNGRETFRNFHFAHLYNFTPTTLTWAGAACGLAPDPRVPSSGTHIAFRKAPGVAAPAFDRNHGEGLSRLYPKDSVARYLLSGRWLASRARQVRRTVRDTVA